jgi:tetratricopeptide (TPR) repeat protein
MVQSRAGNHAWAEKTYLEGLAIYDRLLDPFDTKIALGLHNLAITYRRMGRYPEALAAIDRAADIRARSLGPDHPEYASSLSSKGYLLWRVGRYGEALALQQTVLETRIRKQGAENLVVASTRINMAVCELALGDLDAAERNLEKALDIRSAALDPDHTLIAQTKAYLGWIAVRRGDFEAAARILEGVVERLARSLGYDLNYVDALEAQSELHLHAGEVQQAVACLERAIDVRDEISGPDNPDQAQSLVALGNLYVGIGDPRSAEPLFAKARQLLTRAGLPDHPLVAEIDKRSARQDT